MRRIPSSAQQKEIDYMKNTYPKMQLMNEIELALLVHGEKLFSGANHGRNSKKLENNALIGLRDLYVLLRHLGKHYKISIYRSKEFNDFVQLIYNLDPWFKGPVEEDDKNELFRIGSQAFLFGITAMIKTMPIEFQHTLKGNIVPFVSILNAIIKYDNARNMNERSKRKLAQLNELIIPEELTR